MWDGGSEKEVKEMGDDGDEWEEGVPKPEGPREVQSQVDGDVHMADGERRCKRWKDRGVRTPA